MNMNLNIENTRKALQSFNFKTLFVEELGWSKKPLLFTLFFSLIFFTAHSQTLDTLRGHLREVELSVKYNPAIPIIKKTIQNRNINSQFSNNHFSYL